MGYVRGRRSGTRRYAWGFADQALSSATSLGLSLLAGRALGPSGLGLVFLGFTAYALAVSFQRALVTTPLVASSAALPAAERAESTRAALGVVLFYGLFSTGAFAVVGLAVGGAIGRAVLLFMPWICVALVQDFWRVVLFRDDRPRAAVALDGAWFAVGLVAAVAAWQIETDWAVVGAWGIGAAVAATLGFAQVRTGVPSPRRSSLWWRAKAWRFGRWLALQETLYNISGYFIAVMLTAAVGARGLGGLRAAETLFAPFSLISPALTLPGLPAMTRALATSRAAARRLTAQLTIAPGLVTAAYLAFMLVVGERVLVLAYGDEFEPYARLIFPLGVWQIALALGLGFTIALKAERRGTAILVAGASGSLVTLVAISALAIEYGIFVGSWGLAAGSATTTLVSAFLVFSGSREERRLSSAPSDGAR